MVDDPKYLAAQREVAALKGFYIHLIVFVLVNLLLIAINLSTSSDWWFQWPLIGWGAGLAGHAVLVWSPVSLFGREWEERKIRERLRRD